MATLLEQVEEWKLDKISCGEFTKPTPDYVAPRLGGSYPNMAKIADTGAWVILGNFGTAGLVIEIRGQLMMDGSGNTWRYDGVLPYTTLVGDLPTDPNWTQVDVSPNKARINELTGHYIVADKATAVALGVLPVGTVVEITSADGGKHKFVSISDYSDIGRFLSVSGTSGLERVTQGSVSVKPEWFDADVYTAFTAACAASNSIEVSENTYSITPSQIGELDKPVNVKGGGPDSVIHIPSSNTDRTAFRLGGVGGNDNLAGARVITSFSDLTFTAYTKIDATPVTGVDAESINPINFNRLRMYGLGPESINLTKLYYGSMRDCEFVGSGLKLTNVNNYLISGGGFFGGATGLPSNSTMFGAGPVCEIANVEPFSGAEGVKFEQVVWESFTIPIFNISVAGNITFDACWFENLTGSHLFKLMQAKSLIFQNSKFDMAYTGSGMLFKFDNSGPRTTAEDIRRDGIIIFNGGELRLDRSATTTVKIAEVVNSEAPEIFFDKTILSRGHIFSDPTVIQNVKSLGMTSDDQKSFYSIANAQFSSGYNSWCRDSLSSDWDFATSANFAEKDGTTGLTIATTTTDGEFLTGTRGVKVSGFTSDGVQRRVGRNTGTNGDMGKITIEGETFFFFVRVKSDQNITFKFELQGASLVYAGTPSHTLPADQWRDYVFKSQMDSTWAQGKSFNPTVYLTVTNSSGTSATLFIDRIDYKITNGDVYI